jgi:hypothetical protein
MQRPRLFVLFRCSGAACCAGLCRGDTATSITFEGGKQCRRSCVVAKRLAEVGEAIPIPGPKNEAAAKLKRIPSQFVLMMSGGASAIAALEIVAAKQVQHIGHAQVCDFVGLAPFIDQQGKIDSRFFPENSRIVAVPEADGCERSAFVEEGLLVFAQLRDMLSAKNSSIMAEKNDNGGSALPQRSQSNFLPKSVGKSDVCESLAESWLHDGSSFKKEDSPVNP